MIHALYRSGESLTVGSIKKQKRKATLPLKPSPSSGDGFKDSVTFIYLFSPYNIYFPILSQSGLQPG